MRRLRLAAVLLALAPLRCLAQEEYGHKGIYPVYEASGQWVIFDKKPTKPSRLADGARLLVIGSAGAQLFDVARTSGTYGGACRGHKPLKLRAALLKGPRSAVGRPIIGILVKPGFALKGSRAVYTQLPNKVGEATYAALEPVLRQASAPSMPGVPAEKVQTQIEFGSSLPLEGMPGAFVLVEESAIGANTRRCLRLADGSRLAGDCAEMPRALMAETAQLEFVAYDPSGSGSPFLLAYTKTTPLWGDERWGFILKPDGPRLFLKDAMDIRCREGF